MISIIRNCLEEMHFDTSSLNPEESLVSFGLDSMECVELEQRISQRIGKQLPVGIADKDASLGSLSAFLSDYMEGEEVEKMAEPEEDHIPSGRPNRWQRRLILADSLEPKLKTQFNETVAFRLLDEELIDRMKTALLTLVICNPNLRAVYNFEEKTFLSGTECYILPRHLQADCFPRVGLDIARTIPMAWNVDGTVVTVNFHHVAVDGHSIQLLMKQFEVLLGGGEVSLDKAPFNLTTEGSEEEGTDPQRESSQPLPTDYPSSQAKNRTAGLFGKTLPSGFSKFLRQLRSSCRATDYELLFSAFALAMKWRSGQNELSLGAAVSVRREKEANTIDCLVSVVPVPLVIEEESTVRHFVETIAERLKEEKERIRTSNTGTIQILLVMDKIDPLDIPGLKFLEPSPGVCKYEQTWYFQKTGRDYGIVVEYSAELFMEETIQATVDDVLLAVKRMSAAGGETSLMAVTLSKRLQPQDENQVDYPKSLLDQMINAANYPHFNWTFAGTSLSQKELLSEVSATAWNWEQNYIQHYGEVPTADRQVVIFLPRGLHLVVASLAAWRLGMSIVPISRDWPAKRIRDMVGRLHNPLLVTEDVDLVKQISGDGLATLFHAKEKIGRKENKIWNRMSSVSLGYITCTSGSTGAPKAVCSSIRGLSNLVMNYVRHFSLNHRSRIYQVVNYAFDIFFADLGKSLATGAELVFAEESLPNWNELGSCTNAYIMPAILSSLPWQMTGKLCSLETLQFGGERMQPAALDRLLNTGVHLFQEFGLTEQCVYSSVLRLKRETDNSFLGRPYSNIQLLVRACTGKIQSSYGGGGELYVKGLTARGYHGLGEKNRKRFKDGEFATSDRAVFYNRGLKFVGRMDLQVKILGRRIELGEIEAVLCRYPSVDGAVVTIFEDCIYAYVRGSVNVVELKEYVLENLPSYMVPEEIITVDKFPLNANGKVDKAKLVVPKKEKAQSGSRNPSNEIEAVICMAMEKVLQVPIAVDECFFNKGGNSVKAMLVVQLLKERGLIIGIKEFFVARTAERIAVKIGTQQKWHQEPETVSPVVKLDCSMESHKHLGNSQLISLSHVQRRLWFIQKLQPESDAYTLKLVVELDQGVDYARLIRAVEDVANHNPVLAAEIVEIDGTPYLKISPETKNGVSGMFKTSFGKNRLVLDVNHLAIDGRSLAILAEQLVKAYRGYTLGTLKEWVTTRKDKTELGFWEVYLADVEIHNFPPRHPALTERSHKAGRIVTSVPRRISRRALSRKEKVFTILLHAVVRTMGKVYDEYDIVLGTTVANRTVEDYDTVGMFANTLPLRFNGEITLEGVEEQVLSILEHQNASLEEIQKMAGGELIKCVVNYQNTSLATFGHPFKGCHLVPSEYCQFSLSWIFSDEMTDGEEGIKLTLEYDRSLFAGVDARRFVDWFLKALSLGERHGKTMLREHRVDSPKTSTGRILLEQAALGRRNMAFESKKLKMTYDEALSNSLKIARVIEQNILTLCGKIPRADDIVAIHLEEGLLLHLTINAVLLLGCAYTVIPVSAPEERKKVILQEATPVYVINEDELKGFSLQKKKCYTQQAQLRSLPSDLMYVMFTSGSTGSPKGVPVAHLGVANMLSYTTRLYHLHSRGRVAQFTKSHFDASISNTFCPLANGATLCLLEEDKEAAEAVAELLPLTLLHMTPTVLDYLVQDDIIQLGVESFSIGGEPPSTATVQRLLSTGKRLVQLYGPTEATCYQTSAILRMADSVDCVGNAISNLAFGVCSWNNPVAGREDIGQFFCGGCQLARGYLNDVAKTAGSFIPNPYRSKEDRVLERNGRLYLTGDRIHIDTQGRLHFLGRKDQQVKIAGHRVEVGEVEAALGQLEGVQSVAVVTKKGKIGRNHLVAYYTGAPADHAPLLTKQLPAYMIPVRIIHLERMPVTGNAKIDRIALCQMPIESYETGEEEPSALEQGVLEVYREVLGVKGLTAESNFFHNGGHSLLAVKLAHRLEKKFNATVPIATAWMENTPRRMAKFIEGVATVHSPLVEQLLEYPRPSVLQLPLLRLFRHHTFQEMYTNCVRIRLLKNIREEKIKGVFKELLRQHTSLRTRYRRRGRQITAEMIPEEEFDRIFKKPVDVFTAFPISVHIGQKEVILSTSHVAVDGHSMQVLVEEIKQLLGGGALQSKDKATEFNLYLGNLFDRNRDSSLAYWREKITNWKPNELISDYHRKSPQNYESHTVVRRIKDLPSRLQRLAVEHGVTLFCVLLSAVSHAVRDLLQDSKEPVAIAFPVNMRSEQFNNTATMGVNTALVLLPDGNEFDELKSVGQAIMESLGHPALLEELAKLVGGDKRLYEVMVTFDDYSTYRNEYFEVVREPEKYSKCEISFFAGSASEEIVVDYIKELFKEETIKKILEKVEKVLVQWTQPAEGTVPDAFSLIMPQKQMFFSSFTGQTRVLPFIFKKPFGVDAPHLQRVLHLLVQKYPAFRTVFFLSETGEPLQRVLSITESYRRIRKGTYLKNSPPSSIKMEENVLEVILDDNVVILWLHHIVTDAWSTRILEQELGQLLGGKRTEVEPLKYSIRDCLDSGSRPPPPDYVQSLVAGKTLFPVRNDSKTIWRKVFFISKCQKNIFTTMVSALVATLNIRDSINIGFPFANRTPKTSKLVGYFLNNLVINVGKENLLEIKRKKTETIAWNAPYMELVTVVRQAGKKDDALFQVYLNCRYDLESSTPDDQELVGLLPLSCEFPVEVDVDSYDNEEKITIRALGSYLTEKDFEEFGASLQRRLSTNGHGALLETILKIVDTLLKKKVKKEDNFFSVGGTSLQAIELAEELEDFLGREVDMELIYAAKDFEVLAEKIEGRSPSILPNTEETVRAAAEAKPISSVVPIIVGKKIEVPNGTIHQILEHLSTSNRTMFTLPDQRSLSYSTVIDMAQKRAYSLCQGYLQLCGQSIRSDDIIPVIGKKTTDTWINCFAVQVAGAAYLPISSDTPGSRIKEILSRAHAGTYIGVDFDLSFPFLAIFSTGSRNMVTRNLGIDLAYVISTSGSTGAPKAVCIQHSSIVNTITASVQDLRLTPRDVVYQFTNFSYDNSVLELFSALASSCRLFLDPTPFTPRRFARQITTHTVTHCLLFPGLVSQFKDETLKSLRELKYWVTGAEKLGESLLARAIEVGVNVVQNYGPTETTCYALTRHMRPSDAAANLGRPIWNTRVKIIDGELWVSGRGRMRGYLNRTDSFTIDTDGIWYKTGDLVRVTEDECIIFMGRRDNQVKIRGHRVELDEMGERLLQMEGVEQCRVKWKDPLLTVYCVGPTLSEDKIRKYSERNLPIHMRPNEIHILEELPLTDNSKVDFKALEQAVGKPEHGVVIGICEKILGRTIDSKRALLEQGGNTVLAIRIKRELEKTTRQTVDIEKLLMSPLGTVELETAKPSRVRRTWQLVLGHDNFNNNSHFFLCGGTSLHILRLKVELAKLGLEVSVQDLLSHLILRDMEKLGIPRVVVTLSKSNRPKRTVVFLHPLYGGAAAYVHLETLLEDDETQILAVEHPNTFSFSTESPKFFDSFDLLATEYARQLEGHLEGDIILCGVSIGGTLAVELARRLAIRARTVVMVDTLANPDLETYTFNTHKEQLLRECAFVDNAVLANSWDLLQMLNGHTWKKVEFPLTLLSVDGTDLGWKRYCPPLTVVPIVGPHSALLRPPLVSQLSDIICSLY